MGRKTILVTDDESYIRLLVSCALAGNYRLLEAGNGEEAVEIARREQPDLILMDIMMPRLDGISACYILKSDVETSMIPIVIISVRTDTLDQDYCKNIGVDDYLTKPFDIGLLKRKVACLTGELERPGQLMVRNGQQH